MTTTESAGGSPRPTTDPAAPVGADPLTTEWTGDQVAVMVHLREWALAYAEFNRMLADWLRLPVSDATAMGLIVWAAEAGEPLSPGRLSVELGFTSGAVSILLGRLEYSGHLVRARHPSDARRVLLHPTPSSREQSRRFLAAAGRDISSLLQTTPAGDVHVVAAFLQQLSTATSAAIGELQAPHQ